MKTKKEFKEWQKNCERFTKWYKKLGGDVASQKGMNEAFLKLA